MSDFIYNLSSSSLLLFICGVGLIIAFTMLYLVKKSISYFTTIRPFHKWNQIVSPASQTIGMSYAIIVGLIAVTAYNNFNSADAMVDEESNHLAILYHEVNFFPKEFRSKMQVLIKDYTKEIVTNECPRMRNGQKTGDEGDVILNEIMRNLINYKVASFEDALSKYNFSEKFSKIRSLRYSRIQKSAVFIDQNIWLVVIIGAMLVICINCFYETKLYLHMIAITLITLGACMVIFLIAALDHPFRGAISVECSGFVENLTYMQHNIDSLKN